MCTGSLKKKKKSRLIFEFKSPRRFYSRMMVKCVFAVVLFLLSWSVRSYFNSVKSTPPTSVFYSETVLFYSFYHLSCLIVWSFIGVECLVYCTPSFLLKYCDCFFFKTCLCFSKCEYIHIPL